MPNYQPNETRRDGIKWHAFAHVDKYDPAIVAELTEHLGYEPDGTDFDRLRIKPDDMAEADGNLLTTSGLTRITALITGSGLAFTNTTGRTGVGNVSTAANVADTQLGGNGNSTTAWYQIMDASYPQTSAGVITARSTYATGDGNFAWNEWCWDVFTATVASSNTIGTATLLNHKIASLGTKASGASWVFTTTVTLS